MKKTIFLLLISTVSYAGWGSSWGGQHPGVWRNNHTHRQQYDPAILFDLNPDGAGSGPSLLPSTLGSTGATLALSCDSRDVTTSEWACTSDAGAVSLPKVENGAALAGTPTPFTDTTEAITFISSGDFYGASSSSVLNVGTDDVAFEFIVTATGGSTTGMFGKKNGTGTGAGYGAYCNSGSCGNIRMSFGDGTDNITVDTPATTLAAWNHVICFFKFNTASGARCFANGAGGGAAGTTTIDTLGSGVTFALGSFSTTDLVNESAGMSMRAFKAWTCTGCLATAGYQQIAEERSAAASGIYPVSAAGQYRPTTKTRATTRYLDIDRDSDGVRRLLLVNAGWIGVARRKELTGGEYMEGVLIEPQATNLCLQSATFDNASWTEANVDAIAAGTTEAPDGELAGDTMHAVDAAGDVEHYARQAVTLTATTYTASAWVKAGADADVTHAWIRDNTVANAIGHIVLSTCAAGTKGAGASQLHAENWGNGWCRVGITFTGTVAAHDIDIGYGNADNDTTFDDGTDADSDLIVWGAQVEAQPLPTSYIATTTASATRNADDLRYAAASNADRTIGTIVTTSMFPNVNWTGGNGATVYVAETGTVNNAVGQFCDPSSDFFMVNLLSGGAHQYGAAGTSVSGIDCADGESHQTQIYWTTNRARLYADGSAAGAEDTSITVPATFGTIYIGKNSQTAAYANGIIGRVRIYNEVRTP